MIDFKKYDKQLIKVTKMVDTKFNGQHPNGIYEGDVRQGYLHLENSEKHQCIFLIEGRGMGSRYFHTSQVEKIEEREGHDLVYTLNSIYKVEPQFTAIPGVQEKHSVDIDNS